MTIVEAANNRVGGLGPGEANPILRQRRSRRLDLLGIDLRVVAGQRDLGATRGDGVSVASGSNNAVSRAT